MIPMIRGRIRGLLVGLFVALSLTPILAFSADCRKTGQVCVEGAQTRQIDGMNVYRDCWRFQDTYECVAPNTIDYCAAIAATPGCSITSSVCAQAAFNGTCLVYTNTYRCGNPMAPPTGTVQLDTTYTIVYDHTDTSSCSAYANISSCQLAQKVCTEGPETRNINGLDVFKDCWAWREDYNCVVNNPIDYCSPLKQAGCSKQSETCTNTAFTGECIAKDFTYRCSDELSPVPNNVEYLSTTYTIVTDQIDNQQCQAYDSNANCSLASQTCVDGPGTKNINGLDVYKDCWEWKKDYVCASEVLTTTCDELRDNPLCEETTSQCVDYLPGGQCGLLEHEFKCATGPPTTTTQANCSTQNFCVQGVCFDTGYPPDSDFFKVVSVMEMVREASNYNLFAGEADECSKGLSNCCKTQGGGGGGRNDAIAREAESAVFKVGAETITTWGSTYIFEGLVNSGSEMLANYAWSSLGSLSTFETSVWGVQVSYDAATGFVIGFDPWSLVAAIVIYVIMEMMQCEPDEQTLGMKRGQGLCHKVGSYCASKAFGSCITKKESWCCFPSKLARIVNQQGRPQIGKSWGTPEDPDCSGFTLPELKDLKFDEMDFSEFYNSIVVPAGKGPNFAIDRLESNAQSYYDE